MKNHDSQLMVGLRCVGGARSGAFFSFFNFAAINTFVVSALWRSRQRAICRQKFVVSSICREWTALCREEPAHGQYDNSGSEGLAWLENLGK